MKKPVIIVGAGGHAQVVADLLSQLEFPIMGFVDRDPDKQGHIVDGHKILGGDEEVTNYSPNEIVLVNGIGSIATTQLRQQIFEKFKEQDFKFETLIHPTAIVSDAVTLGEGAVLFAGSIVQTKAQLGNNVVLNTRAQIDHGCCIGDHTHIGPGAILSGDVNVGASVHIGCGAVIIQRVKIGEKAVIGAGSVITKDVPPGLRVAGNPAKEI